MKYPKNTPSHGRMGCCPDLWNSTPDITGSYELDGVIYHACRNKNVAARLATHCCKAPVYGERTAYNSYTNIK